MKKRNYIVLTAIVFVLVAFGIQSQSEAMLYVYTDGMYGSFSNVTSTQPNPMWIQAEYMGLALIWGADFNNPSNLAENPSYIAFCGKSQPYREETWAEGWSKFDGLVLDLGVAPSNKGEYLAGTGIETADLTMRIRMVVTINGELEGDGDVLFDEIITFSPFTITIDESGQFIRRVTPESLQLTSPFSIGGQDYIMRLLPQSRYDGTTDYWTKARIEAVPEPTTMLLLGLGLMGLVGIRRKFLN